MTHRNVISNVVRLQVITAASIKMTALRDSAPCSLVEVYRRFRVLSVSVINRPVGDSKYL
jgi:hypothetical protein